MMAAAISPVALDRAVKGWLEEDLPSFDVGGDVVGTSIAQANFLAKSANGIADDLLSTLVLTATCPVLLAPAMNSDMWSKPAVKRNVARLREDGFHFIDPTPGWLSCRDTGTGRMAEPAEIAERIRQFATDDDESAD